jgi:hypothetical protein
LTSKRAKGSWNLLANTRKKPKRQEHKPGASFAWGRGPVSLGWSAASPPRVVRLNALKYSTPGLELISLFGAAGAILPLIVLSLEKYSSSLASDVILGGFRALVWPTSITTTGIDRLHFSLMCLFSLSLNGAIYLLMGCLVWLGLQGPRSITYLFIVGIMYLTLVGVAGICELLLS